MGAHSYNLSIQEAETGGADDLETSLSYRARSCLKTTTAPSKP
jgi:hypothetical protein